MENAFLAALIMQAADHRLRAECERNMLFENPRYVWEEWFNKIGLERIRHHEGLAEVYDRFAAPFIREAIGEYVMADMEKLTGPAELFPLPAFEFADSYSWPHWQSRYWYGMTVQQPFSFLGGIN